MKFTELICARGDFVSVMHTIDTRRLSHNIQPHYHKSSYEINFIRGTFMSYVLNESEYDLSEYSVVVVPPMSNHSVKNTRNTPCYEAYSIRIDEKILVGTDLSGCFDNGLIINCEKDGIIHNIFKKLDYYYSVLSEKDFYEICSTLAKEILYNIKISKDVNVGKPFTGNAILSDAISYIYENYSTIKSTSEIAKHLYISERNLSKIFNKHLDISPKKYLNRKRLAEAKALILKGVKPTDACYRTGFSDYTVFYRNFTNFFETPPSKIRTKM